MSSVTFKSLSGGVEVKGRARFEADILLRRITEGIAALEKRLEIYRIGSINNADYHHIDHSDPWRRVNSRSEEKFLRSLGFIQKSQLEHVFNYVVSEKITVVEEEFRILDLILNTAFVVGNDVIKFLARFDGQCEIHGYVEWKNRKWLSEVIRRGINTKVLSLYEGWEEVAHFLAQNDSEPVVMDYSVCESFPRVRWGKHTCGKGDDESCLACLAIEQFEGLLEEEQWETAMCALRNGDFGKGLEIDPEHWEDYYFGDGKNVYDLLEAIDEAMKRE